MKQPITNNLYNNFDIINELVDTACDDSDRLMEELGILCTRQGKRYAGSCPVHGGDNITAWNFYPDGETVRGIWTCRTHGCQEKTNKTLIGLIRGILKCSRNQAVDWLIKFNKLKNIRDVKIADPQTLERKRAARVIHKLNTGVITNANQWTRSWVIKQLKIPSTYYIDRGYDSSILTKYDVGFYEAQNRVTVPVYDDDYKFCVGFSARSLYPECPKCNLHHDLNSNCPSDDGEIVRAAKWKNSKGFENHHYLYNYWFAKHHILKTGVAILVEGPGDVWKLEQNGIHNSLALFGIDLSEYQRVLLDKSGALSLIILLDNDAAGIEGAKILKKKLGRAYRLYFPLISQNDVGDLHTDAITKEIEPFIKLAGNLV